MAESSVLGAQRLQLTPAAAAAGAAAPGVFGLLPELCELAPGHPHHHDSCQDPSVIRMVGCFVQPHKAWQFLIQLYRGTAGSFFHTQGWLIIVVMKDYLRKRHSRVGRDVSDLAVSNLFLDPYLRASHGCLPSPL